MDETTERSLIAQRIAVLCAQLEQDEEAYKAADLAEDDAGARAIRIRSIARMREVEEAVADLARRPIRSMQDVERRTGVLLAYFRVLVPQDQLLACPVAHSVAEIFRYAQQRTGGSALLMG